MSLGAANTSDTNDTNHLSLAVLPSCYYKVITIISTTLIKLLHQLNHFFSFLKTLKMSYNPQNASNVDEQRSTLVRQIVDAAEQQRHRRVTTHQNQQLQ